MSKNLKLVVFWIWFFGAGTPPSSTNHLSADSAICTHSNWNTRSINLLPWWSSSPPQAWSRNIKLTCEASLGIWCIFSQDFFTFFRHALMSGTIGALVSDHTPSPLWKVMNHSFSCCILYLFVLQLKAVFLNFVYFHLDEHFQVNRLLIKYWS